MEFHELKKTGLLTQKETNTINHLIDQGKRILGLIENETSYDELKKIITKYAEMINAKRELIENVIDRTLDNDSNLSVHVNELITNTQELLNNLRKAGIINKYNKVITNRLENILAKYKVFLKLGYPINFWTKESRLTRNGVTLNISKADISELVTLLINNYRQEIEKTFLNTDERIIQAGIVNDFMNNLSKESLKQAINNEPEHSEFIIQAYVMLEHEQANIKRLIKIINEDTLKDSETELKNEISLIQNEIIKTSQELHQALAVIKKSREKGINMDALISVYCETEILSKTEEHLKSYLKSKTEIKDLSNQIIYEYLTVYDAIPQELNDYISYKKKSKYYFIKSFFAL